MTNGTSIIAPIFSIKLLSKVISKIACQHNFSFINKHLMQYFASD